jgi:hypothetical protein
VKNPARRSFPHAAACLLAAAAALSASGCALRPPVLAPPPAGVDSVEGYGSASIRGGQAAVKGRFSFLFRKPGFGRIEAFDPFGRTLYEMLFVDDRAYLVLPSRKAYAEGAPAEVMERFLGFSLTPGDVISLLAGQWPQAGVSGQGQGTPWRLERDAEGRVVAGMKGDLTFTVAAFFGRTGVPRTVLFSRPETSGRMKVLSVRFNPAARPEAFALSSLSSFAARSWDEIEEMLRHED